MTRRFGPTRGAGVSVQEQEGDKQIDPAALGWAGYAGIFEKGPVGELILLSGKQAFTKKMGGIIPESLAPDAALDFCKLANGAGGLALVRVTDGNELQAEQIIYQRKAPTDANPRIPLGKIKAANGGRWGGKAYKFTATVTALSSHLTATTLDTLLVSTWKKDQLKGGILELPDVTNKQYKIIGNTAAGVITVEADSTMLADYTAASGASTRFYVTLINDGKAVSYLIGDGEDNPDTEFSLSTFVDGVFVKKYPNLNTDPEEANYWVNVINNDPGNDEIEVEDTWVGSHDGTTRPANVYGRIASVTATVLTKKLFEYTVTSPGGGNPTVGLGTTTDTHVAQVITVTLTGATAGNAVSDLFGSLGAVTFGSLFTPSVKWAPPFTITAGASPAASGDVIVIYYIPMVPGQLAGGFVYPDKVNAKRSRFRIATNDHKTITAVAGSDLTADGASADQFLVEAPQELAGGRDGNADIVDATYEDQAWDTNSSPFNRLAGKNLGLVKMATPGVTSTAVQQAGKAYAEAKNHQYRYEADEDVTTEAAAIELVNETLGRSDYAVMALPSRGFVSDPDPAASRAGKLKLTTLTGMIHGREARIAADFNGYHKAEAGIDATLPGVLKLPTGDAALDEEQLNPAGIQVIKKKKGNFVIWGDRTLYLDPTWKFKHQRELMSYYEQTLMEAFDFIVFAINDPIEQVVALNALSLFFQPEFTKRALRGKTFQDACILKVDAENNTDATMAAGDMFADVSLQLADTVERFNIRIGKQGIFESVS